MGKLARQAKQIKQRKTGGHHGSVPAPLHQA